MKGQRIGYIRVSSLDQHIERQLEGIQLDRIFTDKASGKDSKRPQLDVLMNFVRAGVLYSSIAWIAWREIWTTCAGLYRH